MTVKSGTYTIDGAEVAITTLEQRRREIQYLVTLVSGEWPNQSRLADLCEPHANFGGHLLGEPEASSRVLVVYID